MELMNAPGLWLLGLLPPLILLYILKVKRQRRRVASTWLWASAQRDLLAKSPFKRLVMQVPLILQLLVLLLLALALAKPATRGGDVSGDHIAIVIDTSASMQARGADGRQRIELAKDAAKDLLQGLQPGSDALIIAAGREARVVSALDRDRRRLETAVTRLSARDVEGRMGQAIALANDRLRVLRGDRRIVVLTDGALADRDALSRSGLPLDVVQVGDPVDNTAIVRVDIRTGLTSATPDGTRREQVQAFTLVANYGAKARDVFVTLRQRNVEQPLASRRIQLAPGERSPVVLTFEPTKGDRGSGLLVELSPKDALPEDDIAYGRVPASRKLPVVLAPSTGNPWIRRALRADPDVELLGSAVSGLGSAGIPPDALVVVDGACPASIPGADFLLLNPPAGPCHRVIVGKTLDKPELTSWNQADPRLRFLTLDGVTMLSARKLELESEQDGLVRTKAGAVISDVSLPGRSGTVVGFDVGESNWPLKASFVLFVRNIVELARSHRARGITGPARTGAPLRVRVPHHLQSVALKTPRSDPKAKPQELPVRDGLAIVPEVGEAGFYYVSWKGQRPGSVLVPANLASADESDLSPRMLNAAKGPARTHDASELADAHTTWTWLLAAIALLLVAADAWWLTRRPRRRAPTAAGLSPLRPERREASS